jgi:hypothetical protein
MYALTRLLYGKSRRIGWVKMRNLLQVLLGTYRKGKK